MAAPSTGFVNALYSWAQGNTERITQLTDERDALVAAVLSGGKPVVTLITAALNGKNFTGLSALDVPEKLAVLNDVLVMLGEVCAVPSATFASFYRIQR